jgi:hypothetical protein
MNRQIHTRLREPVLITICCVAVLSAGAAIGIRWSRRPTFVLDVVVVAAVLMGIHDVVTLSISFIAAPVRSSRGVRRRHDL